MRPAGKVHKVSDYRAVLGESPVWDDFAQRLFWVDIEAGLILARQGQTEMKWHLPERVGSIGLTTAAETCVVALETGFALFDLESERLTRIKMPEPLGPEVRFNDGKCDQYGGFIAGTMSEAIPRRPDGALYRLGPDLTVKTLKTGIRVSNGLACLSGGRMVYADSPAQTIWTCRTDGSCLSEEAKFAGPQSFKGVPDGAEFDSSGQLWSAEWDGARLGVFPAAGGAASHVPLPVSRPTSCCFGGPALDTLYITTARDDDDDRLAGHVLAIENAGQGVVANRFRIGGKSS